MREREAARHAKRLRQPDGRCIPFGHLIAGKVAPKSQFPEGRMDDAECQALAAFFGTSVDAADFPEAAIELERETGRQRSTILLDDSSRGR